MSLNSVLSKNRFILLAFLLLLPYSGMSRSNAQRPQQVSLIQLISDPDRFDGKPVIVVGFLVFGSEGDGLFLHQSDFEHGIDANAVAIQRTSEMNANRELLDGKYVLVQGVFQATDRGPLFPKSGIVGKVVRCEMWSDPKHPRAEHNRKIFRQEVHP
jgi:hypothetical protein